MARSFNQTERNLTVLGSETVFNGVLSFNDDLVITGRFTGSIDAKGSLEVDKDAICEVDNIYTNELIVSGKVTGNLYATSSIQLKAGSIVIGDLTTKRLRIEDDVQFQGKVTMLEEVKKIDLFSINPDEYKTAIRK